MQRQSKLLSFRAKSRNLLFDRQKNRFIGSARNDNAKFPW
jgi:hypothetical protein